MTYGAYKHTHIYITDRQESSATTTEITRSGFQPVFMDHETYMKALSK